MRHLTDTTRALRPSAGRACTLLRTLAHEDRLLLLCQLLGGERSVGELEELLAIHQPSLSQQLGVLRSEGLVQTRREGKRIFYRLASDEARTLIDTLHALFCSGRKTAGKPGARPGKPVR
jgi:DNA-binding transcriptional ArsR family regulator